uniref:Putative secreted protein n=1 Tax=Anopheles triannulatus TaxID=58253 RepID=A0A2M4B4X7_9DIPT
MDDFRVGTCALLLAATPHLRADPGDTVPQVLCARYRPEHDQPCELRGTAAQPPARPSPPQPSPLGPSRSATDRGARADCRPGAVRPALPSTTHASPDA